MKGIFMELYHYVPKGTDLSKGIYSVSKLPSELLKYARRAGSDDPDEIMLWLEKTFPGRGRAVSILTEPIHWKQNDPMLKEWLDTKTLVAIDYDKLLSDSLIESVYCKSASAKAGFNEKISQIAFNEIDLSPLPWHLCSEEQGLFFGVIRHYFLVMKKGYIPQTYFKIIP